MTNASIVSHVASDEYRQHVDEMTCEHPGYKRWRVDGRTKFCQDHGVGDNRYRIDIKAHIDELSVITDEMRASWRRAGWKRELTPEILLQCKRKGLYSERRMPCSCRVAECEVRKAGKL